MTDYADVLRGFADAQKEVFALGAHADAEDQLKSPIKQLLRDAGNIRGQTIRSQTEKQERRIGVRPDLGVFAESLIIGHVELKAPGKGANPKAFTSKHDKTQWKKLQSLPNLLYTDGRAFTLFRQDSKAKDGATTQLKPAFQFVMEDDPVHYGADAVSDKNVGDFRRLIDAFLIWEPISPTNVTQLADFLAPITRIMREEVEYALEADTRAFRILQTNWRTQLMPGLNDKQFADAYAQTLVYSMTLATFEDPNAVGASLASRALHDVNPVLSEALDELSHKSAREHLKTSYPLLERYLQYLEPALIQVESGDLWLYFYETFLAKYDPKLRKNYGVYYTPTEVVKLQVRLVDELLRTRFGKPYGFADESVTVLDPAAGTGTYPVAVADHALDAVRELGTGQVAETAKMLARNIYGFEILVGPYAVAHLRLRETLREPLEVVAREQAEASGEDPDEAAEAVRLPGRINLYLANTLESPFLEPEGALSLGTQSLVDEHRAAQAIKREGKVLVCIGNPPYDRQQKDAGETEDDIVRKGGWVRYGDVGAQGRVREFEETEKDVAENRPILSDFTEPASEAGQGVHLKNIYNDYVYFWRWALWRLFEQQQGGGIVSFITASSYLAGPGFVGMREKMRREFDELYIIDLGGDNLGTRKTPNVFQITVPVAVAVGYRTGKPKPDAEAKVFYTRVDGDTRGAKLSEITSCEDLAALDFERAASGWMEPFLPEGQGRYFDWPELYGIFPWSHSGVQFKRVWTIGEQREVLEKRLRRIFVENNQAKIAKLFKATGARSFEKEVKPRGSEALPSIRDQGIEGSLSLIRKYGYRSFDRHYAFLETRFADRFRPELAGSDSSRQLYFSSLSSVSLAEGAAIVSSAYLPDLDFFRGSFGAKHVIPLYRDAAATEPNVTSGLLKLLSDTYGFPVSAEDLAAYVYALLGGQSYTRRFWNELETPGPRVPLTRDGALFKCAAEAGRQLIHLHTYGERFGDGGGIPDGEVSQSGMVGDTMPDAKVPDLYDEQQREIRVGDAVWSPVPPEVWEFEVSGLKVVQSWLGYRMKTRSGKKSSPLDNIRPERWSAETTRELTHLLRILEETLRREPELSALLDEVVAGELFTANELPQPTEADKAAPKPPREEADGTLL